MVASSCRCCGASLAGAQVGVWPIVANGVYDGQDPDMVENPMRGRFLTDEEGRYRFMINRPYGYAVPTDGPVRRPPRAELPSGRFTPRLSSR